MMKLKHIAATTALLLISSQSFAIGEHLMPKLEDDVKVYINNHYDNYGPKAIFCEIKETHGAKSITSQKSGTAGYNKEEQVTRHKWNNKSKDGLIGGTVVCRENGAHNKELLKLEYEVSRNVEYNVFSRKSKLEITKQKLTSNLSDKAIKLEANVKKSSDSKHHAKFYITVNYHR